MTMGSEKAPGGLILNTGLIRDGQAVVLGLSGGPDSVCLLYELLFLSGARRRDGGAGNHVVCAHLNHGLRGEASDGDEAFVASLCEELGAPLESGRMDVASLAREKGMTVEEAGREARYAFFDGVCKKYESRDPVIAVAHNRDDRIETVLMRIMRGTGTDGLAGIAASRKSEAGFDIVRPLLGVSREEIESRLRSYGAAARTDESNLQTEYLRNKLRLEAIPWLEGHVCPRLRQSIFRLAENAAEDKSYFDGIIEETLDRSLERHEAGQGRPRPCPCESAAMPAETLAGANPAIRHRLIRAVFSELGLKRDVAAVHLAAADRLLLTWLGGGQASGKRVEFPLDYTFGIEGGKAVFRTPGAPDPNWKPMRKLGRQE